MNDLLCEIRDILTDSSIKYVAVRVSRALARIDKAFADERPEPVLQLLENQIPLPQEFADVIEKYRWDLYGGDAQSVPVAYTTPADLEMMKKHNTGVIYKDPLSADIPLYAVPQSDAQSVRDAVIEECAMVCDAIANGFVSDINPDYSPDAAKGAHLCAQVIALKSEPPQKPVSED